MKPPLSPTSDFVFKKIFGNNKTVLEDFLKAVLDLPPEEYKDLTVVDSSLDQEFIQDKRGILDIKINTASGKVIDVEVQVKPQSFIWKRMLFYTSKMVVEQLQTGHNYERINRVISILVADFVMVEGIDACHNRFRLYDRNTGVCYPESVEINVLELPKLRESDDTPLYNWMRFFRAKTEEDLMSVSRTNPAIKEACDMVIYLSGDERERAIAEAIEKSRRDHEAYLSDARYEGLQEGLEKGKLEVARNLLREKVSFDTISKTTGLSLEEVKRLAAEP